MPPKDLERRIRDVEDRLAQMGLQQFRYPLDKGSKSVLSRLLDEILSSKIIDLLWNNLYFYSTWFESVDAYEIQSGTVAPDGGVGISLLTGAVSGNTAEMIKSPETQNILRWDREQRFRATIFVNSVTSQTVKVCIGEETPAAGAVKTGYGFKVTNGALKGISANGTSETEIDLSTTLSTGGSAGVDLEARFAPGDKIVFIVNKIEKGVITTNLPSLDLTPLHDPFFNAWIKTNAAGAKTLYVTYFEYIQKR